MRQCSRSLVTPIRLTRRRYPQINETERIRVLLADSTHIQCQLLEGALHRSRYPFEILASVTSRAEALELLQRQMPDVVVLGEDIGEGQFSGFGLLHQIHRDYPALRTILLLRTATPELVVDAFRLGARGVFSGENSCESLCKSISAVHRGQIWANSRQLEYLLNALAKASPPSLTLPAEHKLLTEREREVASLVAEGMTNHEIADKLHLSEHTVSNYLYRIYETLGLSSRVELVLYVVRQLQMGT